ncbi:MAG: hypothetical protein A2V77_11755 [Anaeromyxobacter sp. RBG_16_69_14]|nr:MAG: hypothetical protein A2V77_11755 [Anaeromyxobacter sp. RBG_16_69_14]
MKPVAEQTLYEILDVRCDAPESEIVKAWERAEALYGLDSLTTYTLISPDEAALLSERLEEALNVLLDPDARQRYDMEICGKSARRAACAAASAARTPLEVVALPPVIPPLARSHVARLADELFPPVVAESAPVVLTIAKDAEPEPAEATAGEPMVTSAAVETPAGGALSCGAGEGAGEDDRASVPATAAILLSAVAVAPPRPIPLATAVHVSPPFAAVTEVAAAPALPHVEPPPPPAPRPVQGPVRAEEVFFVPEGTRFTGEVLRRAREARGLTIPQICERTKITRHHIENLENDRFEKLPAAVYLRGILMAMAKELRLDGQKVARSYLEATGAAASQGRAR